MTWQYHWDDDRSSASPRGELRYTSHKGELVGYTFTGDDSEPDLVDYTGLGRMSAKDALSVKQAAEARRPMRRQL